MKTRKKILFCLACMCYISFAHGQRQVDTLAKKDYMQLLQLLNTQQTKKGQNLVADYLIKKAKKEKNTKFLIGGYAAKSMIYEDDHVLKYADSAIAIAIPSNNILYAIEMFETKADYYYFEKKNYKEAFGNHLKVSEYARKIGNKKHLLRAHYEIGILKRRIGDWEAAIESYRLVYNYSFSNKNSLDTMAYLGAISAIASIYNDRKLADSSSYYNKLGTQEAIRLKQASYLKYFALNEGITLFYKNQFKNAIDSLENNIPYYEQTESKLNLSIAYYYNGKSYYKLFNKSKAIYNFKKVDTIFQLTNNISPIARDAYVELIAYVKGRNDLKNQLYYVNQLIKVDSILNADELYLSKTIYKEYDIPNLKADKIALQSQMQQNKKLNTYLYIASITVLLIVISLLIYQSQKRKSYKVKFNNLIHRQELEKTTPISNSSIAVQVEESALATVEKVESLKNELDINTDIIDGILSQLQEFEITQGFLSNGLNLNQLAETFETNGNYLSRIINHHYDASFSNYLNKLRIDYFVHEAKTNPSIAKYTIKAIAADMGFNNAESFSNAFYKFYGLKPSYFLRELEKTRDNLV